MHVGLIKHFGEVQHIVRACRFSTVGGNVFTYAHGTVVEDPEQSMWFLEFYSNVRFLVAAARNLSESDWMIQVPRDSLFGKKKQ
jgi:hypothetical protein